MGYSNGRITAPVSITDIKNALSIGSTNALSTLCKSDSINKWSKRRPFPFNASSFASATERDNAIKSVNYGFNASSVLWASSADYFRQIYTSKWGCEKPSTHFRMGDFDGYVTSGYSSSSSGGYLVAPFGITLSTGSGSSSVSKSSSLFLSIAVDSTSGLMTLDEFSNSTLPLKDWYMGVVILNSSSFYVFVSGYTATSLRDNTVEIPLSSIPAGTYTIIPVLSNTTRASWGGWISGSNVCSIDGCYLSNISVTNPPASTNSIYSISGTISGGQSNWTIAITITLSAAYSGNSTTISLKGITDEEGNYHTTQSTVSGTISAGQRSCIINLSRSALTNASSIEIGFPHSLFIYESDLQVSYSSTPSNPIEFNAWASYEIELW